MELHHQLSFDYPETEAHQLIALRPAAHDFVNTRAGGDQGLLRIQAGFGME